MRSEVRLVAAALASVLGLGACSEAPNSALAATSASDDAARPLELVVSERPTTLDPRYSTRALDVKVTRLLHAGLIGLDPDTLEPVPLLAERWTWRDPQTLVLELAPRRFHSGKALAPEDVCATLKALVSPAVASPHRAVAASLRDCRGLDLRSVELTLREPRATLLTDLEMPILRADQAFSPPRPGGELDGLGPYRLRLGDPSESGTRDALELVPMVPGAPAVVVRTVRDANARALRIAAGRADLVPNGVSPELLGALAERPGVHVATRPGANVSYLLFQNDRAPFAARDARHAVAHALDRERIVRELFLERAAVADWLFPASHWSSPKGLPRLEVTPERSAPTLRALPPVTLLTSTDRFRVLVARALAQMLGDAGLSVTVVSLDLGVLLQRLDAGDFELALLQMPELTEPNVLRWFFHPDSVPGEGGEGRNRARYRSARAGELLDHAAAVSDRDARRADYAALAALMLDDLPVLPLWHEDQTVVTSARAAGFLPSAEGRWSALVELRP